MNLTAGSSEISVGLCVYQTILYNILQDNNPCRYQWEKLKSYTQTHLFTKRLSST